MITTATKRKSIGQMLVAKGLLTQQALDAVLETQKSQGRQKLLGELLVEQGLLTEEQLCETLADVYGVPYAKVSPKICDPKVIDVLPREFLEKHLVLPMFLVNGVLTVATALAEPSNLIFDRRNSAVDGARGAGGGDRRSGILRTRCRRICRRRMFSLSTTLLTRFGRRTSRWWSRRSRTSGTCRRWRGIRR